MRIYPIVHSLLVMLLSAGFDPAIGAEATGGTAGETTGSQPLEGHVVKVEVTLNNLRDARLSISRVRKAAANLYDEVTRQQVTMSYNPNMVGSTVIMTPTASFSGAYLPPRAQWVNESMAEIGPIIKLFKEDVDTAIESDRRTQVREATREALESVKTDAFAAVKSGFDLYQELQRLTAGPSYDNGAIASATRSLDKKMKQLDGSLKKGIGLLQKEARASRKV